MERKFKQVVVTRKLSLKQNTKKNTKKNPMICNLEFTTNTNTFYISCHDSMESQFMQ